MSVKIEIGVFVRGTPIKVKYETLRRVGQELHSRWIAVAEETLNATLDYYLKGLHEPINGTAAASVTLEDKFAEMIEEGSPSYDIKPGLMASPSARTNNRGEKYIRIPAHYIDPRGATGKPQRAQFQGRDGKLHSRYNRSKFPKGRLEQAQALGPHEKLVGARAFGTTGGRHGSPYPIFSPKIHSTPRKATGAYRASGNNRITLESFVTVKENSEGWIHPGWPGEGIANVVFKDMRAAVPDIVATVLAEFGYDPDKYAVEWTTENV